MKLPRNVHLPKANKTIRFEDEDKQRTRVFFFFPQILKRGTEESLILVLFTKKVNKAILIEGG